MSQNNRISYEISPSHIFPRVSVFLAQLFKGYRIVCVKHCCFCQYLALFYTLSFSRLTVSLCSRLCDPFIHKMTIFPKNVPLLGGASLYSLLWGVPLGEYPPPPVAPLKYSETNSTFWSWDPKLAKGKPTGLHSSWAGGWSQRVKNPNWQKRDYLAIYQHGWGVIELRSVLKQLQLYLWSGQTGTSMFQVLSTNDLAMLPFQQVADKLP